MSDGTERRMLENVAEAPEASLYERVGLWLEAAGCEHRENREYGCYIVNMKLRFGKVEGLIIPKAIGEGETESIAVLWYLPEFVPLPRRAAVAELLNRFNCEDGHSKLRVDMSDGWVSSRAGSDSVGRPFHEGTFIALLFEATRSINRVYHAVLSVAFGEISPERAYEQTRAIDERKNSGEKLQ